jgi:hypothetical protein
MAIRYSFGRERSGSFDFIASDDLRGVFARDRCTYGAPAPIVSGLAVCWELVSTASISVAFTASTPTSLRSRTFGDFRIPQLPLGNRWQIGGIPANVTLCTLTCFTPSTPVGRCN